MVCVFLLAVRGGWCGQAVVNASRQSNSIGLTWVPKVAVISMSPSRRPANALELAVKK
jgi:hypothetical protein